MSARISIVGATTNQTSKPVGASMILSTSVPVRRVKFRSGQPAMANARGARWRVHQLVHPVRSFFSHAVAGRGCLNTIAFVLDAESRRHSSAISLCRAVYFLTTTRNA